VISVVVLRNHTDLLNGELGSSDESCVTSTVDGNKVTSIRVSHITVEEDKQYLYSDELCTTVCFLETFRCICL